MLDELVHVHSSGARHHGPLTRSVVGVGDPVNDDLVNWVGLIDGAGRLDHLLDTDILPDEVFQVREFIATLALEANRGVQAVGVGGLASGFLVVLQLVVVKEADQFALVGLQSHLAGELVDSEPLHDVEDVKLQIELLLGVLVEPVLALGLHAAAAAPCGAEVA